MKKKKSYRGPYMHTNNNEYIVQWISTENKKEKKVSSISSLSRLIVVILIPHVMLDADIEVNDSQQRSEKHIQKYNQIS